MASDSAVRRLIQCRFASAAAEAVYGANGRSIVKIVNLYLGGTIKFANHGIKSVRVGATTILPCQIVLLCKG